MRLLDPLHKLLAASWRALRAFPHAGSISMLIAVGIMAVAQMLGYHLSEMPWMPASGTDLDNIKGWETPSVSLLVFYYWMPYLKLWALLGGVVYHIILLRNYPDAKKMVGPTWLALGFLALWAVCSDLRDQLEYSRLTMMGEPASVASYAFKLVMIVVACLTPAAGLSYYANSKIMNRYLMRSFLQPLVFCFAAICTLWIMLDMLDTLRDFQETHTPKLSIAIFYLKLIPYIYVETIWAAVLLATLFTLMKMSRSNEIISMLGTGLSLGQVLRPFFVTGLLVSLVSLAANYYWAPRAEGNREAIMRALGDSEEGASLAQSLMYRDEPNHRTWFVANFPFNLREEKLRGVEVYSENEKGQLTHSLRAPSAYWWPDGRWSFYRAVEMTYKEGNPDEQIRHNVEGSSSRLDIADWSETPWKIISSSLQPDNMSVQELVSYLAAHEAVAKAKLAAFRTQLFHRFAYPLQCLIAVIIGAPLGVSYSRRGVLGGVAGAIFALIGLVYFNQMFLSLGKGMKLAAPVTVWMPHVIIGAIGLVLFSYRARNRDLPSFSWLTQWFKRKKKKAAPVARPA